VLPTLAIAGYIAASVPYGEAVELSRGFSGWERLLTEARILWQYLFHAFMPQPGAFGPFRDGYPVARTMWDLLTFGAVAAWSAALGLAVLRRRRYPLLAFGVLWFAAGHMVESTVVPLELYFEHRNYLPIAGPIFAALAALSRVPVSYRKLARAGAVAYVALNAVVLFSNNSLWGNPWLAAHYWQIQFPDSVRATTTAASFRLEEEGPQAARRSLEKLAEREPEAAYVLIPALSLSCMISPGAEHGQELEELASLLPGMDFSYTVGRMLSDLYTTSRRVNCNGVTGDAVIELAEAVLRNERYASNGAYKRLHHQLLARILRDRGEFEQALEHLRRAGDYGRDADLNMMMVTTYADAGRLDEARDFIDAARESSPYHPFRRFVWNSGLDELDAYIAALANVAASEGG
jgi:tetratricopeptide (TPR) repeat protein